MDTSIQKAVRRGIDLLYSTGDYKPHRHGRRCNNILNGVLHKDEETILEVRQSYLRSPAPDRIIVTNKRIIIARPSFWGFWLGHNLISPTDVCIVPYSHVISVIISRGRFLSSIHLRIHGFTDASSSIRNEGEIYGIRTPYATMFTLFVEGVIEEMLHGEISEDAVQVHGDADNNVEKIKIATKEVITKESLPNGIELAEAKEMASKEGSKFVWLGVESTESVAALLGIDVSRIARFSVQQVSNITSDQALELNGSILVYYDDTVSSHISTLLKKNFSVDTYVLAGGARKVAEHISSNWLDK